MTEKGEWCNPGEQGSSVPAAEAQPQAQPVDGPDWIAASAYWHKRVEAAEHTIAERDATAKRLAKAVNIELADLRNRWNQAERTISELREAVELGAERAARVIMGNLVDVFAQFGAKIEQPKVDEAALGVAAIIREELARTTDTGEKKC